MNKQLICNYINYNAPTLHDLGDKLRAMIDERYRLYHIGPDITPSQIVSIRNNNNHLSVIASKDIKGFPVYKIPKPLKLSGKSLLLINDKKVYQEYILNLTSDAFFWDNFAMFRSGLHWMLAIIPEPFSLPRWHIMDRWQIFISVKFSNGMSCPVVETEDIDYNIVLTPVDNEYIQDLIS